MNLNYNSSSKLIETMSNGKCPISNSKLENWETYNRGKFSGSNTACHCSTIVEALKYSLSYRWKTQESKIIEETITKLEEINFEYNNYNYNIYMFSNYLGATTNDISFYEYAEATKEPYSFNINGNLFDLNNFNAREFADKIKLLITFN